MKPFMALCLSVLLTSCVGQTVDTPQKDEQNSQPVGGGCDGCELMYIGIPEDISSRDTSAGWSDDHQKLQINGTVYKQDGSTPAAGVIIYYWHTDETGRYTASEQTDAGARRHGDLRGWVKSDSEGHYTIYTCRPGAYPDGNEPQHIHFSVKEPAIKNEYYIDDMVFADDSLLEKSKEKRAYPQRGGSGIVELMVSDGILIANHRVVLGQNIPNYPGQ